MLKTKKTKTGWVIETLTNRQGDLTGRKRLYKKKTLEAFGLSYDSDPDAVGEISVLCSNAECLQHNCWADKILNHGHVVQ